jgi:hypothetical protein
MRAFTKGGFNAIELGDAFAQGKLVVGSATINQNATNAVFTHGLGATPDFVLVTGDGTTAADRAIVAAPGATVITVSHADTDGATQTVWLLAGILE